MYNLEIFRVFQKVILDQAIELNFFHKIIWNTFHQIQMTLKTKVSHLKDNFQETNKKGVSDLSPRLQSTDSKQVKSPAS